MPGLRSELWLGLGVGIWAGCSSSRGESLRIIVVMQMLVLLLLVEKDRVLKENNLKTQLSAPSEFQVIYPLLSES